MELGLKDKKYSSRGPRAASATRPPGIRRRGRRRSVLRARPTAGGDGPGRAAQPRDQRPQRGALPQLPGTMRLAPPSVTARASSCRRRSSSLLAFVFSLTRGEPVRSGR